MGKGGRGGGRGAGRIVGTLDRRPRLENELFLLLQSGSKSQSSRSHVPGTHYQEAVAGHGEKVPVGAFSDLTPWPFSLLGHSWMRMSVGKWCDLPGGLTLELALLS